MTETSEKSKKLTLGGGKLSLGNINKDKVSKDIAAGRKGVQVEVKKKRRTAAGSNPEMSLESLVQTLPGGLTAGEREVRLKVLQRATEEENRRIEAEDLRKAEDAKRQAEEDAKLKEAEIAKKANQKPEEVLTPADIEAATIPDEKTGTVRPIKAVKKVDFEREVEKEEKKPAKVVRSEPRRRSQKLTIAEALSEREERVRSLASVRRQRAKGRRVDESPKDKVLRDIILPEVITVQELANRMTERVVDVTKSLMKMGMMVTANQTIDADTAELVVEEFGHRYKRVTDADVEELLNVVESDAPGELYPRPPVVTFMGHVDHGKTSLLDTIRKARVAEGEAGGITQHIGAYQVKAPSGDYITFLDTPGHEAFTEMRKRGANATDIVVLVVAADDGIMEQTIEAINHAKAAGVSIIVAINKMDKPGADASRIRNSLLTHELVTEEFGGDVIAIEVSAKEGTNIDVLLESILLQAELMELQANPNRSAVGIVVEARVEKARGVVATILVQHGTLRLGDIVVAGEAHGKVRVMNDAYGRPVSEAGPSFPVEVLGLDIAPDAGVSVAMADSEKIARDVVEYRQNFARDMKVVKDKRGSLEELFQKASVDGGLKELPILVKADVQGSAEAIISSLQKLATDEVAVRVLHSGVGGVTTSDISLASASGAIVLGFNVRAETSAKEMANNEKVDIRYYSIIYDMIDDIKAVLGGMLKPEIREEFLGNAEIRDIFNMSKYGKVAGCYVTEGMMKRGAGVRLLRDNVVIHEGKLKTLRRFKDDVKEVATNFECGMAFENYEGIKEGDTIEAFELTERQRTLD
jgi:translation initiation factor IF-2